jgi:hypothetical protein
LPTGWRTRKVGYVSPEAESRGPASNRPLAMNMLAGAGALLPLVWNGVAITVGSERS